MRSFDDARRWVETGTSVFLDAAAGLDESAYDAPSLLPGWSRKHLVAHLAGNAEGLGNLVHWAATGEPTPMYASWEQRAADIERGARWSAPELDTWVRSSAAELGAAMSRLSDRQWMTEVVTGRGRTVPATEIPWLRAREVYVHAVDLGLGVSFADLPEDFLAALVADIQAKRGLDELPEGPLPEVAAWLAGRAHALVDAPGIGPWL